MMIQFGAVSVPAVTITEFLSRTEDEATWVELHNEADATVSLQGYRLSSSAGVSLALDQFVLGTGDFLVLDLALERRAGWLRLIDPSGQVAQEIEYREQRRGFSFGVNAHGEERFFVTPSPGKANAAGVLGLVADTTFSVDGGFYEHPFEVAISCATEGAIIRYTLDGSCVRNSTSLRLEHRN